MCTVTWLVDGGAYELYFNRDERRTRRRADPPRMHHCNGVRFLAPTDPDGGGTWLTVNEFGVSVGVLNGAEAASPALGRSYSSRGLLVLELADSSSVRDVLARVRDHALERYRPFHMLAIDEHESVASARWNGQHLVIDEGLGAQAALFSSSRDPVRAALERSTVLERMRQAEGVLDARALSTFHRSHEPERGPYSVCMHREDATTVSFSRVRVERRRVEFRYHPAAPCEPAEDTVAILTRDDPGASVTGAHESE